MFHYYPCEYYCVYLTHPMILPFLVRQELLKRGEDDPYDEYDEMQMGERIKEVLRLPLDQFLDLIKRNALDKLWWDSEYVCGGDIDELEDPETPDQDRIIAIEPTFDGWFYKLLPDGTVDENGPSYVLGPDDTVYTIPLNKFKPSLFEQSYKDMGEVIEEVKEKLARLVELPENFPYEEVIGKLYGTTWVDD